MSTAGAKAKASMVPCQHIDLLPSYKGRRRGKLQRDRYLREDISCVSPLCDSALCHAPKPGLAAKGSWLEAGASHYAIPDVNTLLRFLEVFELSNWTNVIFLRSVLNEVGGRCTATISDKRVFVRLRSATTRCCAASRL